MGIEPTNGTTNGTTAELPTLRQLLTSPHAKAAIETMLPPGVTFARVMREFYNALADNPKIAKCEPASIVRAIAKAASWDLVIGDTCFLVPRKGKLCAQQGYKGKIELMVRHRAARLVHAEPVYKNEHFRYEQGTSPRIEHMPRPFDTPDERGPLVGAYAYAKISAYECKIVVLSKQEIDDIRREFSFEWKDGALDEIPWYAVKTAVHRLAKQVPTSPRLAQLLNDDVEEDEDDDRAVAGTAVAVVDRSPDSRHEREVSPPRQLSAPAVPATLIDLARTQQPEEALLVMQSAQVAPAKAMAKPLPHPNELLDDAEPNDVDDETPF
jgi:recombination protein RecT